MHALDKPPLPQAPGIGVRIQAVAIQAVAIQVVAIQEVAILCPRLSMQ